MEGKSNRVLLGKNYNQKLPMASTTKIMTCILALEHANLSDKVTVSSYAASMPDVQLNMIAGDHFYLKDLLYSLMLASHNDTAVAIAEHIGKSVKGFASLMNEKAQELGLSHTHFVTPNGLDNNKHYTTAKELCLLANYAMQNKKFRSIIATPSHQFQNCEKSRSYQVTNHDAFLTGYQGALGIKTGFTGNAGYCFCGAAKRNGMLLLSSVLACGWPPHKSYKWMDTKALMDYGFHSFQIVTLPRADIPKKLPVTKGNKCAVAIEVIEKEKLRFPLQSADTLTHQLKFPKKLTAPIRKNDILGYENYYLNGRLIYQIPIVAKENVTKRNLSYYQKIVCDFFFRFL